MQEQNKDRQFYTGQKFCSEPNRPSCKTYLDCIILHTDWPLQSIEILHPHQCIVVLLCDKIDMQIKSLLVDC